MALDFDTDPIGAILEYAVLQVRYLAGTEPRRSLNGTNKISDTRTLISSIPGEALGARSPKLTC